MRKLVQILAILLLLSVELYALYAVVHPRVSSEYRAFFIDRSTNEWNPPHYHATPEQGIDFTRDGWPDFVSGVYGFSSFEPWGRWSDADLLALPRIVLTRQFSGPLCIEMVAQPAYTEQGKQVQVAFGKNVSDLTLSDSDFANYRLNFPDAPPADTLEFHFPNQIPRLNDVVRGSADARRLGIRLRSLRILSHQCSVQ
jgi:phosphoglycerol transferase